MMTILRRGWWIPALALLACGSLAWAGSLVPVTTLASLAPDDSYSWSQFASSGGSVDGATAPFASMAVSATGTNSLYLGYVSYDSSSFTGGRVSVQCPAAGGCSWNGGFTSGDALLVPDDTGNAYYMALLLANPVDALGLYIQPEASGPFWVSYQVVYADSTSSLMAIVSSDASGDPVFVGMRDADHTGIVQVVIGAYPLDFLTRYSFAADTLYTYGGVPEPAGLSLAGTLLVLGAAGIARRRPARAR